MLLQHVLSEVDEEKKIGICVVCGPVRVHPATGSQRLACGQAWWCGRAPPERQQGKPSQESIERRRAAAIEAGGTCAHALSNIDMHGMTADCVLCAPKFGRVRVYKAEGARARAGGDLVVCGRRPASRKAPGKTTHVLSNIDESKRLATCALCGQTKIVWRPYANGGGVWGCYTTRNSAGQTTYKPNADYKHVICPFCGKHHRWDRHSGKACREKVFDYFGRKCAACGKTQDEVKLAIDHSHETGEVRGLLCYVCNMACGKLKDNAEAMRNAAAYLESAQVRLEDLREGIKKSA